MRPPAEPAPAYRAALARRLDALEPAARARLAPHLRPGLVRETAAPGTPAPRPASPLAALLHELAERRGAQPEAQAPWVRLSVQRELVRAQAAQAAQPGQAGPLNSEALALRTLQWLQARAPGMLEGLVAQLEALHWLEESRPRRR